MIAFCIDGRSNLSKVLVACNDFLSLHVATFFWPDLVFEEATGSACGDKFSDSPKNVEWISITGIGIDNNRDFDTLTYSARAIDHLRLSEKPNVWFANIGR